MAFKRGLKCAVPLVLALTLLSTACSTVTGGTVNSAAPAEKEEFPLWAKDLRRAEIIAFGTFPFTMFLSTFITDGVRYIEHESDPRYAPWPFKTAGAINMSKEEHERTMLIAASASVALALTDFIIVKIKRYKLAKKAGNVPAGDPIIIKQSPIEEPAPPEEPEPGPLIEAGGLP
ncbi:hypothetical protein FACS189442_1030 [Spirochaetia bacterium]|nr:hypothetical protein FACS189442_1030 [Spirochaetia bacterium]